MGRSGRTLSANGFVLGMEGLGFLSLLFVPCRLFSRSLLGATEESTLHESLDWESKDEEHFSFTVTLFLLLFGFFLSPDLRRRSRPRCLGLRFRGVGQMVDIGETVSSSWHFPMSDGPSRCPVLESCRPKRCGGCPGGGRGTTVPPSETSQSAKSLGSTHVSSLSGFLYNAFLVDWGS